MTIPVRDLLYAHGLMCEYASGDEGEFEGREDAVRLCEVLNAFHTELKSSLVKDIPFEVSKHELKISGDVIEYFRVQPVGGWDSFEIKDIGL